MELTDQEIIVGTYEEFVLGYKIVKKLKTKDEYELVPSFTNRAHIGPVRSVVGVNKFLVSGGSDELCKVFDLSKRVEHGQLMNHEGTISCLAGFGKNYVFAASDDNSISVTKVGSWQVEKTLYKHQAGITALAVHPTGKLAFSAGKDRKLVTWNLVKARPAFITNLKGIAEFLVCSPDGSRYCVGIHRRIDVYNIDGAGIEYTIDLKCRPNGLAFLDNNTVAVGGENTKVQIHSLIERKLIKEFEAHETRVRCIQVIPESSLTKEEIKPETIEVEEEEEKEKPEKSQKSESGHVLVTASSSDHMIKLWRVLTDTESEVRCIGSFDTTCRITCLTTWNEGMKGTKKRKNPGAGETVPTPVKKIKLSEGVSKKNQNNFEEITVEEEQSATKSPKDPSKLKKKKKKNNFVVSENI